MTTNPLNDYFRKPEVSVRLPAGTWYHNGEVDFNMSGEVDVYSMLPADEIMLTNPDALVTGTAISEILKSCVPAVKRPEDLYYPDVNALLLAIQKATYGSKLTQGAICPKCAEKRQEIVFKRIVELCDERKLLLDKLTQEQANDIRNQAIEDTKDKIGVLERDNKLRLRPIEGQFAYDDLVAMTTYLPKEKTVQIKDLTIYCAPYRCSDRVNFANMNIRQTKIKEMYEQIRSKGSDEIDRDYVDTVSNTLEQYKLVNRQVIELVAGGVLKIVLPTGEEVEDRGFITEFLQNTSVTDLNAVRSTIEELTYTGVPSKLGFDCPCCGEHWEETFNGFNPADFFGISS